MDNNAFKELVRSKVKSTKEIAREAVEDAFHKKKRKRKGRGRKISNDDDLSSSESEPEGRAYKREKVDQRHAQHLQILPASVRNQKKNKNGDDGDDQDEAPRYRDRAKERREGKNADYKDSETMMETMASNSTGRAGEVETSMDQTEISKYLGGDEAHTHLVKGLDVALARSVRSQTQQYSSGDEESNDEDNNKVQNRRAEEWKPIVSSEEAWEYISRVDSDTSATRSLLGRSMLQYWKSRRTRGWDSHVSTTAAGAVLQRSQITFSAVGNHPLNLATCWEIPTETSHAAITTQNTPLSKVSPLDTQLILKIQKVQSVSTRSDVGTTAASNNNKQGQETPGTAHNKGETAATDQSEEESDEDIFQNVRD